MNKIAPADLKLKRWIAPPNRRGFPVPTRVSAEEKEYYSLGQLEDCGRELCHADIVVKPPKPKTPFRTRVEHDRALIAEVYRNNLAASDADHIISPAAEWLLDNFLLIAESSAQVWRDLPPRFYGQLPIVQSADDVQEPRVMQIARHCAQHSLFEVTQPRLTAIVNGYQQGCALKIGELWALPAVLRFVLIEELARIAKSIDQARVMRGYADAMADLQQQSGVFEAGRLIEPEYENCVADDAFSAQLLYRLGSGGAEMRETIAWLEQRLALRETSADEVLIAEQNRQSAANVRIGNLILSLRTLNDINWSKWLVSVSVVDAKLRERSDFAALESRSQSQYRRAVEELARWSRQDEPYVAEAALDLVDSSGRVAAAPDVGRNWGPDVGSFFVGPDRMRLEQALGAKVPRRVRLGRWYKSLGWLAIAGPVFLLTLMLVAGAFGLLEMGPSGVVATVALMLLTLPPASEAATGFFNTVAAMFTEPTRLVGYAYENGVPATARTMVVVPCLIASRDTIDDLVRTLEVHHLSNPKGEISFALLSDWPDSAQERSEEDDALLAYARQQIAELSGRYRQDGRTRFFLLHRTRLYNPGQGVWMGWERKRGKLMELGALLRGETDTTYLPSDAPLPDGVKYIMTLDADTRMTRDAVTRLVGKMEHPLNHPQIDCDTGLVRSGYGVMQPRVTPSLTTGKQASVFQRVFSANRGFDPYVFAVSDVYQDLVGEGSFTGKGLYHLDTFRQRLAGIGENAVLSHDLLEGGLARCALVTDVELVEDFPIRYEEEVARQHRWARGDWQLLPFLSGARLPMSALQRWKIIDNLRRSLVPVAWLGASMLGWTLLSGGEALIWQVLLVLSLFVSPTFAVIRDVVRTPKDVALLPHLRSLADSVEDATNQVILRVIFIAHTATVMVDAIWRTLYRLFLSRRNLLEWQASGIAPRVARTSAFGYWASMRWSVAIALSAVAVTVALNGAWYIAVFFGILWVAAPVVAWAVSQSTETEDMLAVSPSDRTALRHIARRTWTYFETFVTEEHNWLPPDNYQEIPTAVVAGRTSPTNIGLYLLSVVAARDFGWIGMIKTVSRLEQTIATMSRLEKHNGHLFNWYDTRRAMPLEPRYVSTVDSGNLAGHLIAVSAACTDWAAQVHVAHLEVEFDGLRDCLGVLAEELDTIPNDRRTLRPLRHHVTTRIDDLYRALRSMKQAPEHASVRIIALSVIAADIETLVRDYDSEVGTTASKSAVDWAQALLRTCREQIADTSLSRHAREALRIRLEAVAQKTREAAFKMDFAFLMRQDRMLLSIGYRPGDDKLDESVYDLLASEARLASFFGIAKGDLPAEHWLRLGRPVVPVGARGSLISWAGSMFEYLMPALVMQEQRGGILNQSNRLSVRRQIEYAEKRGFPWGISESAFNARDPEMTYQYMTFGVPSLAIKRGLASQAVVAPYATILASQFQPRAAVSNLAHFQQLGVLGEYGFYDAVDFTPSRLPENETHVVVRNFMAHHQGMSIAAICNVVYEGLLRERFHSDAVIEAAELLLQERAPRTVPRKVTRIETEPVLGKSELSVAGHMIVEDPAAQPNAVGLLSNGHYSLLLSSRGSARATWNGQAVTRWWPDCVEASAGPYLFMRDMDSGKWWSATADPRRVEGEQARTIISDNKIEFHKQVGTLRSRMDVIVASGRDAEGRCLTLTNTGPRDRVIEVTSYAEPVIGSVDADFAHPVFSRMFVHTEISPDRQAIHARRNPRGPGEPDMHVAHMMLDCGTATGAAQAETDRRRFIGRGRTLAEAAAFDSGAALSGSDGFTLDPIFALRRTLLVPAGKSAQIIFWTIAAPSRAEIDEALTHFVHEEQFGYEAMQAWTRSQIQLRHVNSDLAEAAMFRRLAPYLIWPGVALKPFRKNDAPAAQSALWPMGISGDFPIMVLRIDATDDIAVVRKAMRAQRYFQSRGLVIDLVILNERAASYIQDLQTQIEGIAESMGAGSHVPGGREHIFTLRRDKLADVSYEALLAAARIVLHARNGTFAVQIDRAESLAEFHQTAEPAIIVGPRPAGKLLAPPTTAHNTHEDLQFWNGYGGFGKDGRDYVVRLKAGEATPQPWINVISNGDFGFHVSAEGAGFTWSRNSRDHHLTPWSNDAVMNRPGEAIYLTDRDSGEVFTPFAALSDRPEARFEACHTAGVSRFACTDTTLTVKAIQTVDPHDPVKFTQLSVTNTGKTLKRLRLYCYVEWVMGNSRYKTAPMLRTHTQDGIMLVENPFSTQFPGRTGFLACNAPVSSFTTNRSAFLGMGSVLRPDAVAQGADLARNVTALGDPCAALAIDLDVAPGETRDVTLLLGDAPGQDAALALAQKHQNSAVQDALAANVQEWDDFLNVLQVKTPDPAFDIMVNRWLPYQTLACRIRARSAFYQASGAFGFRDQLQDTLSLLLHDPKLARAQILNAAGRQFPEGDVQHWWLPETGAGVRTMISDDVVWLAYGITQYLTCTGDTALLDEMVPFLTGAKLEPGEHDRFFQPETAEMATVYEHAALALDLAVKRTGEHGLALFLGGDWNDGMNRVGEAGKGESVWLSWFLAHALDVFAPLAEARGDHARVQHWRDHLAALTPAIESAGWDGGYYRRGYYDDGTPLGSAESEECRIDSIAQSWSVMSGQGDPARRNAVMDQVLRQLVDDEAQIIKLFTPPFSETNREPGYIKGYPPGVRENGGQYTHAATWTVYALAMLGRGNDAKRCFDMLNPINHSLTRNAADHYRVEPYVVAADVYGADDKIGRGGWTWYTGSAGWLYRAAVEAILGISKRGDRLIVKPNLPSDWPGFEATLTLEGKTFQIDVSGKDIRINGHAVDAETGLAV